MIDFKQKENVAPSAAIVLSIIVIVVALVVLLAVPKPLYRDDSASKQRSIARSIETAKSQTQDTAHWLRPKLWLGNPDLVSSGVLGALTQYSNQGMLKLSAFRPQKGQILSGMTEMPFSVQLSGSYAGVRHVLTALDAPASKIVLRSAQINATDQGDTEVTAIIGVSAYVPSDLVVQTALQATNGSKVNTAVKKAVSLKKDLAAKRQSPKKQPLKSIASAEGGRNGEA